MVSTDGVLRHLVGMRAKYMLLDHERSDEAGSEGRADLGTLRSGMDNAESVSSAMTRDRPTDAACLVRDCLNGAISGNEPTR